MTARRTVRRGQCMAALLASAAAVVRPAPTRAADEYTLRMNLVTPANSIFGLVALRLAREVQRRSNGQLKIEVYPSLQLATEQQSIDGMINGTIDLTMQASAPLVPLFPRFQVFDMPFLFKDNETGYRVLDRSIGTEFFSQMEAKGILGFGWGISGFKELETTTKVVATPDDMKGLRVRINNSAIYSATYQALGALPVVMDVSESFVALTQRTVDAIDINLNAFTSGKFYAAAKHVTMLNHFSSVTVLMGSKRKIDALPAPLQRILKEEARSVVPFWRTTTTQQAPEDMETLKKNGVTFTEISYPAFRRAVDPVYAAFGSRIGADLIARINRDATR